MRRQAPAVVMLENAVIGSLPQIAYGRLTLQMQRGEIHADVLRGVADVEEPYIERLCTGAIGHPYHFPVSFV